jgi:phosphatidylglycerol:prolipoprotein diacylglycerol transferase
MFYKPDPSEAECSRNIFFSSMEPLMSNTYPWFFSLGALASLLWLGLTDPISKKQKTSLPANARIDAGLAVLVSGLLGARLGYVLMHTHFYTYHPLEILKLWNGGLSWVGGTIGAVLGLRIYTMVSRHPFWRVADTIALPATLFTFALWFGCMLDGCAYGKVADVGFLTPSLQDPFGTRENRWPIQSTGAIFSLGILVLLDRVRLRKPMDGTIASLGLMSISGTNFLLAFFRGDPVPVLYGLRSDALASVILMIIGSLSLIYCTRRDENSGIKETSQ